MHFLALRAVAVVALVLLLWNPTSARPLPVGDQPVVLLDASLSMSGGNGEAWRAALDSARRLARERGALVWRFGSRVAAFDTAPPREGASRLATALEAAAGRGGEVVVISDGALDDASTIPSDLRRRPRVVVTPHAPFADGYVASVEGARHVTRGDTVRLRVSYGTAGVSGPGPGARGGTLTVSAGNRRLVAQRVSLPDSGTVSTELTFPASRIPNPGWTVLEVRLDGVADAEPRDDARLFAIDVSLQPAAVILASPPDWDAQFLARALTEVARLPVKVFVETEPDRWRDAATLAPVAPAELTRAAAASRLIVLAGEADRARRLIASRPGAALLVWATTGQDGDWYVDRPPPSPLGAALAGIAWDSLPPATAAGVSRRDSGAAATAVLTARLARRGAARPIVTLEQRASGARQATVTAAGLWRWAFRGGASQQAYRAIVSGLVDWLLGEQAAGSMERVVPVTLEVPNGLPLLWRWNGSEDARPVAITLDSGGATRTDTLRFDAGGHAELLLPPGIYRYALPGGAERGVVAVETYSDEWRPRPPTLTAQPGESIGRHVAVGLRDRWWLFVIAIAALAGEWAWRRRQGLP